VIARTPLPRARLLHCCRVVLLALGAQAGFLHAQAIPGSGELLQQTPRPATAAPSSNTGLTIQEPTPLRLDDTTTFLVQHIEISGNTLLPTAELRSLVSASEGKKLNFSNLQQLATLITRRYQDRGYLLSRAYIPPQTIKDGTVRIAVLEARYGAVSLSNTSNVSDALLRSYFTTLRTDQPVTEAPLERSLLLASDIPGAVVSSSLAPGVAPGTSDLKVSAAPGEPYSGYAAVDDAGNRYTGRTRASGTFDLNNPLHQGDVLSATALTAGENFTYGRLGYQALLDDGAGTSVSGALSGLYYHLGDSASDLHAHGTAEVATVSLMQPFIRSTEGNLFLQIGVDRKL
jgi:hemolysin activation/secretion protein